MTCLKIKIGMKVAFVILIPKKWVFSPYICFFFGQEKRPILLLSGVLPYCNFQLNRHSDADNGDIPI